MAKAVFYSGGMPVDQPIEVEPGLTLRERDYPGFAGEGRGFLADFPDSHFDAVKGDRPFSTLQREWPIVRGPFKNVR